MKRTDITPRTILAERPGTYGSFVPAAVLDTETLWELSSYRGKREFSKSDNTRPGRNGSGYTGWRKTGFLAITSTKRYGDDLDLDITAALERVPEGNLTEKDVNNLAKELPDTAKLVVINNRNLHGDYHAMKLQEQREHEAEERKRENARKRCASNKAYLDAIKDALEKRGTSGEATARTVSGDETVTIDIDVLGAILDVERPPNEEA